MTITENKELIFIDFEEKTQCVSIETIKEMWKAYKKSKEPVQTSCANYERDNCPEIIDAVEFDGKCEDPIVQSVRQKLLDRCSVGIKKYATTLKENTKDNYLNHLQQEMLDGANYIEVLLQQQLDITQLCLKYPNDDRLGKEVRKIYS